ncbi:MAG: DUF255 domain-containing protein [Bacteroidia bacterium]
MKIRTQLLILFAAIILCSFGIEEKKSNEAILWMSMKEALAKNEKQPKKIFIDMYTSWCGWCKKMDAATFTDSKIAEYMNAHYYAVKFDAETKDTIVYKDKPYTFVPEYKSNELAARLLNGQMSYPTAVYMDEKNNPITAVPGYLSPNDLLPILVFFAEDHYKTEKWEEFRSAFDKK